MKIKITVLLAVVVLAFASQARADDDAVTTAASAKEDKDSEIAENQSDAADTKDGNVKLDTSPGALKQTTDPVRYTCKQTGISAVNQQQEDTVEGCEKRVYGEQTYEEIQECKQKHFGYTNPEGRRKGTPAKIDKKKCTPENINKYQKCHDNAVTKSGNKQVGDSTGEVNKCVAEAGVK